MLSSAAALSTAVASMSATPKYRQYSAVSTIGSVSRAHYADGSIYPPLCPQTCSAPPTALKLGTPPTSPQTCCVELVEACESSKYSCLVTLTNNTEYELVLKSGFTDEK